jgi:putative NADH-flavin reductase
MTHRVVVDYLQASGHLGPYLLKALQANSSFDVTVVSRQSSTAQFPPNTKVVKISDSYPKNEILDVFKGQDAVVLSLNFAAEQQHHNMLVDASVEAGVKRLLPSMWCGRLDLQEAQEIFPLAALKAQLLDHVKSISSPGWSYTAVCCGLFMDLCVYTYFLTYYLH